MKNIDYSTMGIEDIRELMFFGKKKLYENDTEVKRYMRHIQEQERSMYSLLLQVCSEPENILLTEILRLHDDIIEKEVLSFQIYKNRSRPLIEEQTMEQYQKDIAESDKDVYINYDKGYIYILKNQNQYKIGKTTNFEKRFNAHKTSNPLIEKVYVSEEVHFHTALETMLHRLFAHESVAREWFCGSDITTVKFMVSTHLVLAESIITRVIKKAMEDKIPYKKVYPLAKDALDNFADSLYLTHKKEIK